MDQREREEIRGRGWKDETEETASERALDESERVNEVDALRIMSTVGVRTGTTAIETGVAEVVGTARGEGINKESAARGEGTEMGGEVDQA